MIRIGVLILTAAFAPDFQGKTPKGDPRPAPTQQGRTQNVKKRIQVQRIRFKHLGVQQSHIQVRVKLRNTQTLQGIVKNGLFVEKPTRLEFVPAEMKSKGAGIRLWFFNGTAGYIFLPYTQIKTYKIVKRVSEVELKAIHEKIKKEEEAAKELSAKRLAEIEKKKKDREATKKADEKFEEIVQDAKKKLLSLEEKKKLLKLVAEYPPEEGWGADKLEEIRLRRIAIGAYPDEKSRRFIEVFKDWEKGVKLKKELEEEKKAEKKAKEEAKKGASGKEPGKKIG